MEREWHDEERFWREMRPVLFNRQRCEAAPSEVDALLKLVDVAPRAAVLDMPCGVGRHSIELAKRGYRVTAIDRFGPYVEEAESVATASGVDVEWRTGDMREFLREESFDLALNLFTSLGYFDNPNDDLRVLGNYHRSLKPGGTIVVEMMGREILARIFRKRTWDEFEDGVILLEDRVIEDDWRSTRTRWILLKGNERYEHTMRLRNFAADDLVELLEQAGFGDARVYGSLDGTPYDHDARRLVVVAKKAIHVSNT